MPDRMPEIMREVAATMGGEVPAAVTDQPDYAALCSSMSAYDIVDPEKFVRGILDRNIAKANSYFAQAFGHDRSPLQASVDRLQAVGSVALFDVGCGTGNTLRTWAAAVRQHAEAADAVTATGINLYDYSGQSRFPQTHKAIDRGEITYLVGDAQHMHGVADASADVLLACMSVYHMPRPEQALAAMIRVARPGAALFLNVRSDQYDSNSPVMEAVYELEDAGYTADDRIGLVENPDGRPAFETLFIRIEKPENP